MSYLSADERAALRAQLGNAKRAEALVNPASGLANDYLNLFNEIVMLVESLPTMPDLFEDIQNWRPTSYRDYFRRSILPGRGSAIDNYDRLDARFRRNFESVVEELDRRATGSVAAVRRHFKARTSDNDVSLAVVCERAGANIREVLDKATALVNTGEVMSAEMVQTRTDALLAKLNSSAA